MKVAIFLKMLLNAIRRILGVVGFVHFCSIPAHADNPKKFDKSDPPAELILTLPDQWPAAEKVSQSINKSVVAAHNSNDETQVPPVKRVPVNVACDMDVVQNTVGDVSLSNRFYGECDLHFHY